MALLTHSSPQVARFLRNLALDRGLFEAFAEDREAILEDLELSEEDRVHLLSVNVEELREHLSYFEPMMGSGMQATEPMMGSGMQATEPCMGTVDRLS